MGNSSSQTFSSVNLSDYTEVSERGDSRVLKHVTTGRQLQEHRLYFHDEEQLKKYEDAVRWRNSQDHIVEAVGFKSLTTQKLCSRIITANVYVEHLLVKLSDIKDIPHPENVYIAKACLQGFSKLYYRVGYFHIEQDLIGINHQGIVKVWLNRNMSCISPSWTANRSEEAMARSIIDIVDSNSDPAYQSMLLAKFIGQRKCKTFQDFRELVREYESVYGCTTNCTRILEILKPTDVLNKTVVMDLNSESSVQGLSKTVMVNDSTIVQRNALAVRPTNIPVSAMLHIVRRDIPNAIPTNIVVHKTRSLPKRHSNEVNQNHIRPTVTQKMKSHVPKTIPMPPKMKEMAPLPFLSKQSSRQTRFPTESCQDTDLINQVSEPLADRANYPTFKLNKMPSAVERTVGSMVELSFKNSTKSLVLSSEQLKKKLKDARKSQNIFSEKSENESVPLTREELQELDPEIAADILMLNL